MKLLVLGGTRFVGRAIVAVALDRGIDVTVVSRGDSGTPPASATWHRADRRDAAAMRSLGETGWDAVIDTWAEDPAVVAMSAALLSGCAAWYGYVSSRSVYRWPLAPGSDESAPVVGTEAGPGYASDKRGGELAVLAHFGGRSMLARAGLIVGPGEDTGRLTWWLERAASPGPMVAPQPADQVWQLVDVRDLASFVVDGAERGTNGTFNVVCPRSACITTRRLVDACVTAANAGAALTWVAPAVLARAGVREWDDLPGWIPPGSEGEGLHHCDVSAATAAGLRCRSIETTASDTWAWMQTWPARKLPVKPGQPSRGLTAAQEQAIWWLRGRVS
jgi:nucleoside-diphosphate-sugar epimerase